MSVPVSVSGPVPLPQHLLDARRIEVVHTTHRKLKPARGWIPIEKMPNGFPLTFPLPIRPTVAKSVVGKLVSAFTNGSLTKDGCRGSIVYDGCLYSITGGVKVMAECSNKSTPNGWNYSEVEIYPGRWVKTSFIRPGTQQNGKYTSKSESKKRKHFNLSM